jgi:hypothetical protein
VLNRLFLIPSLITPHGVIWDSPYIILQERTANAELSDAGFSIGQVHKSVFFIDAYSYMAYSNGTSDEIVNRTIAAFDELVTIGDLLVD